MYQPNEIETWRQRREDLRREAEGEYLAWRLEEARPNRVDRIRSALRGLLPGDAAVNLSAEDSRCA